MLLLKILLSIIVYIVVGGALIALMVKYKIIDPRDEDEASLIFAILVWPFIGVAWVAYVTCVQYKKFLEKIYDKEND
jgi:membrane protein CcdC involved in cytochrome C biogenesis